MNYQKNKEFVEYYVENVLMDLLPMMKNVINEYIIETKSYPYTIKYINKENGIVKIETLIKQVDEKRHIYTDEEVKQIFFNHTNINEFDKFCNILNIDYENIHIWFQKYDKQTYFYKLLEDKYKQYFRDERRRERNLKRKQIYKWNVHL